MKRFDDALPDALMSPAAIAAVDRLPGTELGREIPPVAASSNHPQHAADDASMVEHGSPDHRLLGWQQRTDPGPLLVGQIKLHRLEDVDLGAAGKDGMLPCPARGVARLRDGLMPAA